MDSSERKQEGSRLPLGQSSAKAKKRGRRHLEGDNEEEEVARHRQEERMKSINGSSNDVQDSRDEPAGNLEEKGSQQQPPIVQDEAQVNTANEPQKRQLEQQVVQDEVGRTTMSNDSSMPPPPGMNNTFLASASAGLTLAQKTTAAVFPGLDAQGNLLNPHMFMFPIRPQLPLGKLVPGSQAQLPATSLLPTGQNGHLLVGLGMQPDCGKGSNSQTGNQQEGQAAATLGKNNIALPFAGFQVTALQQLMLQQQGGPVDMNAACMMMAMPGMPMSMMGKMPNMSLVAITKSPAMSLRLSFDDEHLSEYQILVRKQLEVFEAQQDDVQSNTQGRKKSVTLGQVGLRCKHCAGLPLRQRGKGAVYYPTKLQGIYQAAQNMANSHLAESCQLIGDDLKAAIKALRQRRDTASGGKMYWADGARALGIYEAVDGLRIAQRGSGGLPAVT